MGIVVVSAKTLISIGFLLIAWLTYELGMQRNAVEFSDLDKADRLSFVRTATLQQRAVNAIDTGAISEGQNIARYLAVRSPVDELPYEVALASAVAAGDVEAAKEFANHALSRQPRSLAARLYLFQTAAEGQDVFQLIEQYQRLVELRSLNRHVLSDALIGAVRATGDWSQLLEYLDAKPHTAGMLIDRLIREPDMPIQFEEVLKSYPEKQSRYINRVMRDDSLRAAFLVWQTFSDPKHEHHASIPFNGELQIRPEPAPFNWLVKSDLAEFQRTGGLYISYPGRGDPSFVEQILAAPEGVYTLRSELTGRMPKNGGTLEWQLACVESGELISTLVLSLENVSTLQVFETEVEIPSEFCNFQKLELIGRPGAFPKTSRIEILSVAMMSSAEKAN